MTKHALITGGAGFIASNLADAYIARGWRVTIIDNLSTGLQLSIGPTIGRAVIAGFASDPGGVVDLTGGIGGFTDTAMVLAALQSDGRGGTLLSFGQSHFLDFAGVKPEQLHATNFHIG